MAAEGQCFPWAYEHLPDARNATLVHGTVHAWDGTAFKHAWIERAGRVFDWQSVVQGLGPGPNGYPKAKFYAFFKPVDLKTYSFEEAQARPWLHHGPSRLVNRS